MNSIFDELLDEINALQDERNLAKSLSFWEPPPRSAADHERAMKKLNAEINTLNKSLQPTPEERRAQQREELIRRCRVELPRMVERSKESLRKGLISGQQAIQNEIRVHHFTAKLAAHGIQL
ncbi:MAG: hypothetical protein ACREVE_10520 [Gammaproteobacteria bacterium]